MSNAATTAGARSLDHDWVMGSLPCTKPGMKGGPRVLDLSKIIDSGGTSLAQLSVLECVEILAPLVESLGHQEVSSFSAMTEAMVAGDATVGTAAFRKAAGPRVMAAWGLEGLRGSLHSRGSKVFLPALPAQDPSARQPPTTQQELGGAPVHQPELDELPETQQEIAAAPAVQAPESTGGQDRLIEQLRARLAIAEATCVVVGTTPGKGPGARAGAAATAAVAPTSAQRQAANDVLQQEENKKFVDLVQSKDVPRELRLKLDAVLETLRDASGVLTWYDLRDRLSEAMQRAADLNLLIERKVLGDVIARGTQMMLVFHNAPGVLGMFSRMLPSIRGVSQEVAEADMAEMRKLQVMHRNQYSALGAAGYGGTALAGGGYGVAPPAAKGYGGAAPAGGGARASGRKHSQSAPFAGGMHSNAFPVAHVYTPPNRVRMGPPARAATAPGHYGPQLARSGAGRGGGGPGGGRGAATLPVAEKAAIRAQRAAQHSSMQQQQLNTPGNPNGTDVCKNCARAGRDQFHSHLTCAWQVCMWCKLAGHRKAACTNDFAPEV